MTIYTPQQIRQLAYDAGFRGAALDMAVAVALAESGGNPLAYNPESAAGTKAGSGSRGLWQIYGAAHPNYNNDTAFDPRENAKAAFEVYQAAGQKFTPWSTYNNGSAGKIVKTLPGGVQGVNLGASATGTTQGSNLSIQSLPNPLAPTIATANKISAALSDPVKVKQIETDVGFIVTGSILVTVGLVLFFYSAGKDVVASQAGGVIKSVLKGGG